MTGISICYDNDKRKQKLHDEKHEKTVNEGPQGICQKGQNTTIRFLGSNQLEQMDEVHE